MRRGLRFSRRFVIPALIAAAAQAMAGPAVAQSFPTGQLAEVFGEPVTSSATGMPQRASDAPADITIITQQDISRSGATTIPEILQYVAGVDVRQYGIADAEVGIEGYNQPYNPGLLVLVNGRQVYRDDYGHVAWASIPVQLGEIRQIEIIRGPNSALYGFNAADGVINIVTFDPLLENINTATIGAGTQSQVTGSLIGTAHIGETAGVRISLGGLEGEDYPPDGLSPTNAEARRSPQIGTSNLTARVQLSPGVSLYSDGSLTDSRVAEENFTGTYDTLNLETNSLRAELDADSRAGFFTLNAYRNGVHESVFNPSFANVPGWLDQRVYVVQGSDLIRLDNANVVRLGLEYRNNAATSPGFVRGTVGYQDLAADAMWNWRITQRLSLTNAVRIDKLLLHYDGSLAPDTGLTNADYNNESFTVPSFNSGLVWRATDRDTLRLLVAQGMQAPSLVDFGLQFPAGTAAPVPVAGNPELQPAVVDSVTLGWNHRLRSLGSVLGAAIFAARNRDLIAPPFSAPLAIGPEGIPVLLAQNVGTSDALGFRIGLKGGSGGGWRWDASYSFVATTNGTDLNQGPVATSVIDYANSTPRNAIILGVGRTWRRFDVDLFGRWQSSYIDFRSMVANQSIILEPVDVANYVSLSGRIAYHLTPHVTLALTAQQFNAASLTMTAGPPVERQALVLLTTHF